MWAKWLLWLVLAVIAGYLLLALGVAWRAKLERRAHLSWTFPLGTSQDSQPAVLADGTIVAGGSGGFFFLSPQGELVAQHVPLRDWFYKRASFIGVTASAVGNQFIVTLRPENAEHQLQPLLIRALNSHAEVMWELQTDIGTVARSIAGGGGQIYLGLNDESVCALSSAGELLWKLPEGAINPCLLSAAPDGTLYVGGEDQKLHAFSPQGQRLWQLQLPVNAESELACAADGTLLLSGGINLSAVNSGGQLLWNMVPPGYSGNVSSSNINHGSWLQRVFPWLFELRPQREYDSHEPTKWNISPVTDGTQVYFVSRPSAQLFAVDFQGRECWAQEIGGKLTSPALGANGRIYVASLGQGLFAYTPAGHLAWCNTGVTDIVTNVALGSDGTVLAETEDTLVAFTP